MTHSLKESSRCSHCGSLCLCGEIGEKRIQHRDKAQASSATKHVKKRSQTLSSCVISGGFVDRRLRCYRNTIHEITRSGRLSFRLVTLVVVCSFLASFGSLAPAQQPVFNVARFDRARVLKAANQYLSEKPITITASSNPRSAGGLHDFFSEADYWWPDPDNPTGPYIQRDGMTNPENFVEHRRALMRLSVQVPALVAAWKLTRDTRYARHAAAHLRAWFIDERTRMNPNLQYAQAIRGRVTGRGTGIIDTIHLVEVARAIEVLKDSPALSMTELGAITQWFSDYLAWMTTSKNGIEERDAKNNHGTCWVMQVSEFARLTGNQELLAYCRDRFKTVFVPNQFAADGSFPQELRRTKPYGYSLFNLEAMAAVCQILSTPKDNLWTFELPDGRGMRKALAYMAPYIKDKKTWPLPKDVMYDEHWPMRQSSLLFAGLALNQTDYLDLWKTLPADSNVEEVVRNFFIRQPVLWVN
jgi:Alginate lyase